MSERPSDLRTLEYSRRWGIEPLFSDFKSHGFGVEDPQIRYANPRFKSQSEHHP